MFSRNELLFMIDALNGIVCSSDTLSANLWGWVEYAGELAEKIDPNVLIGKVDRLSTADRTSLHSELEEFWQVETISNIDDRMRQCGLLKWLVA